MTDDMSDDLSDNPPSEALLFPLDIFNAKALQKIATLNPQIKIEKLCDNKISLTTARAINFKGIWDISAQRNFEQLADLNKDLKLELIKSNLVISPPMSSIIGQLFHWNFAGGNRFGILGESSTQYLLPNGDFLSPDHGWYTFARWLAVNNRACDKNRFPDVPHYVNETVSAHDSVLDQRDKCGRWISSGVEVASLIDKFRRRTYLYASTASGFLPPGPGVNVHPNYLGVTEQTFVWPALPPPVAINLFHNVQYGPAFIVPLPAGCTMVATGGPFGIDHSQFILSHT